ncbi:MAG: response regulator [Myxococcales bacterium]
MGLLRWTSRIQLVSVLDGWEVLRQKDRDATLSGVPVVVITAAGGGVGRTDHVERILRKPFSVKQVLDTLDPNPS